MGSLWEMDVLTQHQWEHNRLSKEIAEGVKQWTHLHYAHKRKCKAKTRKAARVFGEHGYPDGDGEQGYQTSVRVCARVCVHVCVCTCVQQSAVKEDSIF